MTILVQSCRDKMTYQLKIVQACIIIKINIYSYAL